MRGGNGRACQHHNPAFSKYIRKAAIPMVMEWQHIEAAFA
jgi:hypothetical protein